ncbi:helix-turn-helix domain-containing protein [Rahnella perminowiae]|uniref:Helix-turn-helix domain-containing protein n=1 Tax=Rahnella perminowiae TaxID=2816244 RepID=A0ABS6KXM2_9GAMM|nr:MULTISPECIES: helix-turn-helix domain-containing protein [Rahnella]UJD88944.1 helix-turn-helix domain-containing protein [Rahnella aquatilis]MBU9812201.1 helix-turn-helix domain-containing protein [Rahnella perminowiae]MBU9834109.1 helix-turn-helix domain-containing protein [Rahnella perminowiae]MCR9001966.1 helix-turn-helix domain-containing protein [Rahnella perminowiae]MCX2946171.1 helix-turn-helix domain-containing protein [Rahnella perminowiae]
MQKVDLPLMCSPRYPAAPNRRLVLLAYECLCTFEFGIAVEAFGRADELTGEPLYALSVASVEEGTFGAQGGVRLMVDGGLELLEDAGTIVIPGWRSIHEPASDRLMAALQKAHHNGTRIVSICAGSFVLAAAGLLDGKRATAHWNSTDALAKKFPDVQVEHGMIYVDEGNIITSAGGAAGVDVCLHLIRRDYGIEVANRTARRMVTPPLREGNQAQLIRQPVPRQQTKTLAPLLDDLRGHLNTPLVIDQLAAQAGMSRRTFLRRFHDATGTTPGEWMLNVRLEKACALLENGTLSIDRVAEQAGFGSPETLRHHFRQRLGMTPTMWRKESAERSLPG